MLRVDRVRDREVGIIFELEIGIELGLGIG